MGVYAAEDFVDVQKQVSDILKGRILVGHALHNDLKVRELWLLRAEVDYCAVPRVVYEILFVYVRVIGVVSGPPTEGYQRHVSL